MRILYVGHPDGTCLQRAETLRSLGHEVTFVPAEDPDPGSPLFPLARLGNLLHRPPDLRRANRAIRRAAGEGRWEVLWVDKGRTVRPSTLREFRRRQPGARLVSYSPDDMFNPRNHSVRYGRCLPLYDLHVTTKTYNVDELKSAGAQDVIFVDNAFDPEVHRPYRLTPDEERRYRADVSFVGAWEEDRGGVVAELARRGVPVTVWSPAWPDRHAPRGVTLHPEFLPPVEFSKVLGASRISLGFLRKANRDRQTTRTVEIPACGGFLLAERTDEHLRLFREGLEAEFFETVDELEAKCRHYLAHEEERRKVAEAGRRRCLEDDYSNAGRLRQVLSRLTS